MALNNFLHTKPPLTLRVTSISTTGKELYGYDDGSGLADVYKTYDFNISSLQTLSTGDDNVGTYNGIDVRPGDFFSTLDGLKTWKIISISAKSSQNVIGVLEDINMGIARTYPNKNNSPNNLQGIIYRVNDSNYPLISSNYSQQLTVNNAMDNIATYLQTYNNHQLFTFQPETTDSLQLGDLVTITGSGAGYNLITSSINDTTIGTVFNIYGGEVIVRPYNNIITDFESPEKLQNGEVGSIWYESGSGQITTSSIGNSSPKFLQLTLPQDTLILGTTSNPVLNPTIHSLSINGVDIYTINPSGISQTLGDITQSINTSTDQHYTTAGINQEGGITLITSEDSAGTNGENGTIRFESTYGIIEILSDTAGDPSNTNYPFATGTFSITSSNGHEILVQPTFASSTVNNYPVATEEDITNAINLASNNAGAPIEATFGVNSITITETLGGSLEINKGEPQNGPIPNFHLVGLDSSTGIPTGVFTPPPIQNYLTLTRQDGGQIVLDGTFLQSGNSAGLASTTGIPPYLLMLEGTSTSGADTDWFEGDTYLSASKDVQITGSLLVTRDNTDADFFIISSGSYDAFKVNSEGITQFYAHNNEYVPTVALGGLYFTSASAYIGLE